MRIHLVVCLYCTIIKNLSLYWLIFSINSPHHSSINFSDLTRFISRYFFWCWLVRFYDNTATSPILLLTVVSSFNLILKITEASQLQRESDVGKFQQKSVENLYDCSLLCNINERCNIFMFSSGECYMGEVRELKA